MLDPRTIMTEERIDLLQLWNVVWRDKWVIVAATIVLSAAACAYALLSQPWYQANVLLARAQDQMAEGTAGALSGLLALSGVGFSSANSTEAVAVLKSREFAREFIEDNALVEVLLFDEWDPVNKRWKEEDPEEWPDVRDAITYFHEEVMGVTEDPLTGLTTLSITWTDPEIASQWAESLVRRLNERMRTIALREAESNVAYLHSELERTSVVTLQQSIGGLLEAEMQKLMMARGSTEFAFKIIDPAEIPKDPAPPGRLMVIALGTLLGLTLGVIFVLIRAVIRRGAAAPGSGAT